MDYWHLISKRHQEEKNLGELKRGFQELGFGFEEDKVLELEECSNNLR